MERKWIYFGSVEKALAFLQRVEGQEAIMKVISGSKRVNAKSLLGLFSLDLTEPLVLEITGDSDMRQKAVKVVSDYIREEIA